MEVLSLRVVVFLPLTFLLAMFYAFRILSDLFLLFCWSIPLLWEITSDVVVGHLLRTALIYRDMIRIHLVYHYINAIRLLGIWVILASENRQGVIFMTVTCVYIAAVTVLFYLCRNPHPVTHADSVILPVFITPPIPQQNTEGECSICLDLIVLQDFTLRLPCDHLFHVQCLESWIRDHPNCPNCRRMIT